MKMGLLRKLAMTIPHRHCERNAVKWSNLIFISHGIASQARNDDSAPSLRAKRSEAKQSYVK